MWPRSFDRGMCRFTHTPGSTSKLQCGRDRLIAECPAAQNGSLLGFVASMWPRSFDRGMNFVHGLPQNVRVASMWPRSFDRGMYDFMLAVVVTLNASMWPRSFDRGMTTPSAQATTRRSWLQCGRDRLIAECEIGTLRPLRTTRLQCGRDRLIAECSWPAPARKTWRLQCGRDRLIAEWAKFPIGRSCLARLQCGRDRLIAE